MRRWWSIAAAMALGAGLIVGPASPASSVVLLPPDPNRQCGWPINYPGTANYAFPDTGAAYFVQAAIIGAGDEIVINGRNPKARYWSLQTYRYSDSRLIDSVNDLSVRPRGTRGAQRQQWTVRVTTPDRDNGRDPNVLSAAVWNGKERSNWTVIMYRVYLSGTKAASGGPLPTVTLRSRDASGKVTSTRLKACRGDQIGPPLERPILSPDKSARFAFTRAPDARFYPSADTSYLIATAPYRADEILVMTGRAPRTPQDVRYWSVCQNVNAGDLPVVDCLRDNRVSLTGNRTYTIAVLTAEQRRQVGSAALANVNVLDWGTARGGKFDDAFLIYRNILPNRSFKGSTSRVPIGRLAEPVIGAFAPKLEYISIEDFRDRFDPSGS